VPQILKALNDAEELLSTEAFDDLAQMVEGFKLRDCGNEVKTIIDFFVAARRPSRR